MRAALLTAIVLLACDPVVLAGDPSPDQSLPADLGADVPPAPSPCIQVRSPIDGVVDFGAVARGVPQEAFIIVSGCADRDVSIGTVTLDIAGGDPGFDLPGNTPLTPLLAPRQPGDPIAELKIGVRFLPTTTGRAYTATVNLQTSDPLQPRIAVRLVGFGAWQDVPCEPWRVGVLEGDRAVGPGTPITLQAEPPPGLAREAAQVVWRVRQRPAGSVSNPVEAYDDPEDPAAGGRTDDPQTSSARFFVDEPGVYIFEATTRLDAASGCADQTAQVRVVACPCPGDLHVQLRWRVDPEHPPPVGIRSNLDLHVAHPAAIVWNDPLHDCRSVNPTPDWGVVGLRDDDPFFDSDDADAPGVENIFLARLERPGSISGSYRVAVEHVRPEWTASADVEIRVAGELVWSVQGRALSEAWWDVAAIGWQDGELTIVGLDRTFESRPPLDATLRPGAECLPDSLPPCSPDQVCAGAGPGRPGRCTVPDPQP